ncbi:hypothetical protein BDQ17DRAFT_1355552 [Cyathus striatus]|nr:hypothetical protein BDQ17DRAFT_1355552 [Cyathus striatus]
MFLILLPILIFIHQAFAICSGFEVGIGNLVNLGSGINRCSSHHFLLLFTRNEMSIGNVYNSTCGVIDGLTTDLNPCTESIFGCSPTVVFDAYTNTFSGHGYVNFNVHVCYV